MTRKIIELDELERQRIEMFINPPVILGDGYFIPKFKPYDMNYWRPLGCMNRPLKTLVEAEEKSRPSSLNK